MPPIFVALIVLKFGIVIKLLQWVNVCLILVTLLVLSLIPKLRNRERIAEEIFDLLQVSIRAFVLLTKEKFNIEQLNMRHNKKLINRGWKEKKIINIFIKEWFYMSRLEEVRNLAEGLVEIQVDFIDKDNGRKQGLIFYRYQDFGKWYADNYDAVEVLEVIQSEE